MTGFVPHYSCTITDYKRYNKKEEFAPRTKWHMLADELNTIDHHSINQSVNPEIIAPTIIDRGLKMFIIN